MILEFLNTHDCVVRRLMGREFGDGLITAIGSGMSGGGGGKELRRSVRSGDFIEGAPMRGE